MARDLSLSRVSFLLSFQLATLLVTTSPFPAIASIDAVKRACHQVDKSDFCLYALANNPWAVSCPDVHCLAGGIIPNLAYPRAKAALGRVEWLLKRLPPGQEEALSRCYTSYAQVLSDVEDAQDRFSSGAYSEAEATVARAEDQVVACENGFTSKPTPMTALNNKVAGILNLAEQLLDLLNV